MHVAMSTEVNSSVLLWPDEDRKNAINSENTYLINIWKLHLYLLHFYGTRGADGDLLWVEITHIVSLTCWNPRPPLENHRKVSSRCHSQDFSTYSLFFLNSLPECFLSGHPCVLLGYQQKAHRGHRALKWRDQALHKCLSDVFQPSSKCCQGLRQKGSCSNMAMQHSRYF